MKSCLLLLVFVVLFAVPCPAETVHRKDGRQIKALETWERGDQVRCRMADAMVLGVPKDSVLRVDAGHRVPGNPRSVQLNVRGSIIVSGEWIR